MAVLPGYVATQPSSPATSPRLPDARSSRQEALLQDVVAAFRRWDALGRPERGPGHAAFYALTDACVARMEEDLLPPLDPVEVEVEQMFFVSESIQG